MSIWLQELILLDVKLSRARTPQSIIVILFLLIFFIGIYIPSKNYSLYHDARGALYPPLAGISTTHFHLTQPGLGRKAKLMWSEFSIVTHPRWTLLNCRDRMETAGNGRSLVTNPYKMQTDSVLDYLLQQFVLLIAVLAVIRQDFH